MFSKRVPALLSRCLYDVVLVLQSVILLFLFSLSLFVTVEFIRSEDRSDVFTEYIRFRNASLLFPAAILIIFALLVFSAITLSKIQRRKLVHSVFWISFFIQLAWIASLSLTNYWYADSVMLMHGSNAILQGDFSQFTIDYCGPTDGNSYVSCLNTPDISKGNLYRYFAWYPYQAGPLLWFLFVFSIFGSYNILAFQIINALFISGLICLLLSASELFGLKNIGLSALAVLYLSCIPLLMYSAFVYTNVVGLFFCVLSLVISAKALESPSSLRSVALLALAYFVGAIGVIIKSTFIIFMIAITVVCLLNLLTRFRKGIMLLSFPFFVVAYSISKIPPMILEKIVGQKFGDGMPMVSWVAMGLQEIKPTGPGWWQDDILKQYVASGGNPDVQSRSAWDVISHFFGSFDSTSFSFLFRKLASEWAEPTFQTALYSSQGDRNMQTKGLENFLLAGHGYQLMVGFDNVMQSLIYGLSVGAVIILLIRSIRKKEPCAALVQLFTVTFIGGFLCYILWEAKSVYAFPFYFLLFPLAALGIQFLVEKVKPVIGKLFHFDRITIG
ncbi:glycosyltransferase family 39 protein [Bifidobacterium sp. UTCIF-39]|uniref:glycosyltransferase family 39 protein n=1 Tax=Bifidobacterium sp. UTCIF-39 TaxID=1465359 RepID=UPI001128F3F9|nr:glycosyltransferase family 39 protein [Bifidobacterium sp. UTCIF-39]